MMLSSAIRQNLKTLFLQIGKLEKQLEVLRQILCEQYEFEPYSAFQRLDVERKGHLTALDIQEFLRLNELPITEEDASLYIQRCAQEDPNFITYQEFLVTVLPLDNPDLRTVASQRKVYSVKPGELLSYEVEYALARVIAKEIDYHHALNPIKEELISQDGFSFNVVFALLDPYESGSIDYYTLKEFLKANGAKSSDDDIIAILRRIDLDNDGKINYKEFVNATKPVIIRPSTYVDNKKPLERIEKIKSDLESSFKEKRESLAKQEELERIERQPVGGLFRSPIRTASASSGGKVVQKEYSPLNRKLSNTTGELTGSRKASLHDSGKKGLRSAMKRTLVNDIKRDGSPEKGKDKGEDLVENLLRVLKEIITLEREIETAKEDLAIRTDFNLFDAFRLFDKKGVGVATAGEIELGLNELGIYPSKEDLYLFVRKFDRDADARLKFSDFCDGLIPNQAEYIKMLKARVPVNSDHFFNFKQVFSQQTLKLLKGLLLLHLENEAVIEALRQKLSRDPRFDTHKIFEALDKDEDGFITIFELRRVMEKYNMFITDKDLHYLINRFDRDDKQKISYIEFVQEITPKSSKRY